MSANPRSGESKSDKGKIPVQLITGHTDWVRSVSWDPSSPGSNRIVSGSNDNTVRVWDAVSGQCVLGPLEGHYFAVESVSFSPDGARIVFGSWDNTVRVWNIIMMEFYPLRQEIIKFIKTLTSQGKMRDPRAVLAMRVFFEQNFLPRFKTFVDRASAAGVDIPELENFRAYIEKFLGITTDGVARPDLVENPEYLDQTDGVARPDLVENPEDYDQTRDGGGGESKRPTSTAVMLRF